MKINMPAAMRASLTHGDASFVITLVLSLVTLTANADSQTVHPVSLDLKNNQIILTVANTAANLTANNVEVRAVSIPSSIKLNQTSQKLKVLQAGKDIDCLFSFSTNRSAKPKSLDTLKFLVSDLTGVLSTKSIIVQYEGPSEFALHQNYPNPFNPSTTIPYDLPVAARVKIMLYDILGRAVRTFGNEVQAAGCYDVHVDARNLASGTYVYRIEAQPAAGGKAFVAVKKMMVLK
jgi:hypothetical protein